MTFDATIEALQTDEALRRREFPVVAERVYLAHAAVCPLPARVVAALERYLEQVGQGGQFEYLHAKAEAGAREIAAEFLGASPDEIAFVSSTSAGLSLVAAGLDWQPGDNVVIPDKDFPSNIFPWLDLRRRGVEVRPLPGRGDGLVTPEDVGATVDGKTRLVALSSVHFATGARMDVDAIGRYLQSRGILFCVDAIQSFGVLPLSARHVDFLTADAHKWMLGPQGIGILYVRRSCFDRLHPALIGWKSVASSKDFSKLEIDFPATARRYEPGSLNALGLTGLHAALSILRQVGIPAIADRLRALRGYLVPRLTQKGYRVLGPASPEGPSGITSFCCASDADAVALHRRLDERRIVVSLRDDPTGAKCLRVAPHLYTTEAELDALIEHL